MSIKGGDTVTFHIHTTADGSLQAGWVDVPASSARVDALADDVFDQMLDRAAHEYKETDRFDMNWALHQATEATLEGGGETIAIRVGAFDGHLIMIQTMGADRDAVRELLDATGNSLSHDPIPEGA